MKILVVRPGLSEIPEHLIRNDSDNPLYSMLRAPLLWKTSMSLVLNNAIGALAVANKLIKMGEEVDALEMMDYGIALTRAGIENQNKKISEFLNKGGYDLVCISCMGCEEYLPTKRMAEITKKELPDSTIIAGGYHVSSDAVDTLQSIPEIDIICIGDFEPIAEKLIAALKGREDVSSISNLVFRKDGQVIQTKREYFRIKYIKDIPLLKDSPFTAFYPIYGLHIIEGSRGCPHKCKYCVEPFMRTYYAVKPVDMLLDEIEYRVNIGEQYYGNNAHVPAFFSDPLWGLSKKWIKEFCDKIKLRMKKFKLNFTWRAEMRIDQEVHELFPLMCEAGCGGMSFGVESLNLSTLKRMNKADDVDAYYNKVAKTLKAAVKATDGKQIYVAFNLIFGWPGEQMRDFMRTMERAEKIKKEVGGNIYINVYAATPFPGTELWHMLDDNEMKEKYGLEMLVPRRFWKMGIGSWVPMFNPSRTLKALGIASYASGMLHTGIKKTKKEKSSGWLQEDTFEEYMLTRDILSRDEVVFYASLMREDYAKAASPVETG